MASAGTQLVDVVAKPHQKEWTQMLVYAEDVAKTCEVRQMQDWQLEVAIHADGKILLVWSRWVRG